ncbi:MAG: Rho termination factor N-terminal domain-containing protein [Candidatus Aminicenantes bacterium]|nr:Rho termination factor N-terminal domain-containing protein [Candidatus Aminicenantes bacterium]
MKKNELEKMTVTNLREEARKYEEIEGASGMKKAELVEALWDVLVKLGEAEEEEEKVEVAVSVQEEKAEVAVSVQEQKSQLKKEIKELKAERDKAKKDKDRANIKRIRHKIKKARRKLKLLAVAPPSAE